MKTSLLLLALAGCIAVPAQAQGSLSEKQTQVLKQLMANYAERAKEDAKKRNQKAPAAGFSAEVGREFYLRRRTWQLNDYTCSGCHTENPAKEGKHIDTGKPIKPLAPVANAERFTDVAKVEKNFTEHCKDLHERDCHAHEKGHFLAYLMSVK